MRILMYHEVVEGEPEELHAVSKGQFRLQMRWLHEAGYTSMALSDWLSAGPGKSRNLTAARGVIITFDDGYRDNYHTAWPIMQEFGLGATIFLVAGRMGQTGAWRPGALGRAPLLTLSEAREMSRAGVRFGSHTVNHADLSNLEPAAVEQELRASRQMIEQTLGQPVDTLGYPYSRFTRSVKDMVRQAGYRVACSSPTGYVGAANSDPYDLRRITVLAEDHLDDFAKKVSGNWRLRLSWYRRTLSLWRRQLLNKRLPSVQEARQQ